ncbi:MAG: peptide ABC transporter [Rhodospirillaceae bacterium]|nr:peptide ABC transporter [Rhodospirillaceae bacterium]
MRRWGALLSLIALFVSQPAFAKDTLVIGISQFPNNFNPLIDSMLAKSYMLAFARRRITIYDANWQLTCMLCSELPSIAKGTAVYEKTASGKEGIAITYSIDPRAAWADGTPITTKDVLFTWKVGKHKLTGVADFELFRRITNIEVHDNHRFTLHVNKRTCDYAGIDNFQILPAHLDEENFKEPGEYRNRSAYETDTTNPGLWNGPYRISKVVPGSHVIYELNPYWWGKKPHFKRITVMVIENTASVTANLLAGGIDMIAGELGLTIDQALAFEKHHGDKFVFLYKPGLIYEHIDLNMDNPILKDRRVRRALVHALDREAISSQLYGGYQPVAHANVNPLDRVYNPKVPIYQFDPEKAKALLDQAGWSVMKNGIRHNAKGEALYLELMTTAGNKTRELIQQVLQSQWQQVGIGIRIRNEPPRVYFGNTVTYRKFKALAMYAWLSAPESIPRSQLHSTMIPSNENGWSGQNYPGYRNPTLDRVLDDLEVQCTEPERQQLWDKLQNIYAEELPVLPLYFRANGYILPKWLKGIKPTGHQYPTANWVEYWSVKE